LWFWICTSSKKRKRRSNYWLRSNPMVQASRVVSRRRLRPVDWYVGSRLYNVRTDRWKSFVSWIKWAGSVIFDPEVIRTVTFRPAWEIHKKSTIFGYEISWDSNIGLGRKEIFWKNLPKRFFIYKVTSKNEPKRATNS